MSNRKPTCPKCGEAQLFARATLTETVDVALDHFDEYGEVQIWEMGPSQGEHAYSHVDFDACESDEVTCAACGHVMEMGDVYDQWSDAEADDAETPPIEQQSPS